MVCRCASLVEQTSLVGVCLLYLHAIFLLRNFLWPSVHSAVKQVRLLRRVHQINWRAGGESLLSGVGNDLRVDERQLLAKLGQHTVELWVVRRPTQHILHTFCCLYALSAGQGGVRRVIHVRF